MAIRFTSSGNFKVDAGVNYVKATINVNWDDNANQWGIALKSFSFQADGRTVTFSRPDRRNTGSESYTFNLSGTQSSVTEVSVSYQSQNTPLNIKKESDKKIIFLDGDGSDANARITLSVNDVVYFTAAENPPPAGDTSITVGPTSCPAPTSWESLLPTCGSAPSGINSSDGLQISKTGQNQITLNLKNYPNKLVTLKITHQVDAAWTQSFDFNIPNCSDISPNTGGTPYAKAGYSNSNISGTNTFYVYNIDGGDYDYVFNHSSVAGPRPTRTNYNLICTESCSTNEDGSQSCVTTCVCEPYTETYTGTWPNCPTGVVVSKNGGDRVQWQYEDGGGGNYDDQYVTVEVVSVRSAIGSTGSICTSALKNSVWIADPNDTAANGNCISDYKDHSSKIRFRIPALKQSKTTLPTPLCYSEFRGIAGAASPGEDLGSVSSEYSVLHLFDRDFKTTTSLVSGSGIIVDSLGESDSYVSPYNENPSTNTNLGTTDRRHYLVQFTDGTVVNAEASNIDIAIGQSVTADGLNAAPVFFKKEQVSANSLRVWFYLNYEQNQQQTDDVIHVFDDDTDKTDETLSELDFPFTGVTITPQALNDPGNGTVGYETLNTTDKKHYLVTFTDSTIVSADASNIIFEVNQNKTASNITAKVGIAKKERVGDKSVRVWFTAYYTDRPIGQELDNSFIRDFSINRTRVENFSGNVFARSWYLSKSV